jgi:hypothetical protein
VVDQLVVVIRTGATAAPAPKTNTPAFCPECGTRTEAGAAVCAMCGAKF